MRIGAVFPQLEIGSDPGDIERFARTVEDLGYDHIVVFDHVLGAHPERPGGWRGPYDHESLFHEPFVLYGYLAALTSKVELATAVIILPQRQTALVAKQAAQVDVLSRGRLRLGVGIGWNAVEYEALAEDFHTRGRRIEEQIALMRRLWTEPVVEMAGRWHRISKAGIKPLPVQRPIPVWMGGGYSVAEARVIEPALRRIARIADGWFTHAPPDDAGRAAIERFRELVRAAGRDPGTVGLEGRVYARQGGPDQWARSIEWFGSVGVTHIECSTMGARYGSLDEHLEALRRFRELAGERS